MRDLDPSASALLARARRGLSPTQSERDRVRRAVSAALSVGGAATETPDPASAHVGRPSGAGNIAGGMRQSVAWTLRLLVASAIAASAGSAGYWAGHRAGVRDVPGAAPRSILAAAAPADPRVSVAGSVSTAEPRAALRRDGPLGFEGGRPQRPNSARSSKGQARESTGESLEKELSALRGVERALRDRQPSLALALLRELARAVPGGKLIEERDATTAIARCAVGDTPFDVDLAEDFAARHPGSVYLKRVTEACAGAGADARKTGGHPR